MEKYRAIPDGYMRIGELAKKTGVTVRTLQYYDKEGLLAPSGESDGGMRLYTDKDAVRLMQILMMKELGLSLSQIKQRLTHMNTSDDVISVLAEQANDISKKIEQLTDSLSAIEALREEIIQMETVDFRRYAAILFNLQMKNENYQMLKYFDNKNFEKFSERLGAVDAIEFIKITNSINNQASVFYKKGIPPESEEVQKFAKSYWEGMMKFYGGDMDSLREMSTQVEKMKAENKLNEKFVSAYDYTKKAMKIYFSKLEENQ
ncbi:MAG: MerR family transcriptional regulator [Defluviitaleaceae bacterium]|nr:MerR family transcriptional regulator [Defluviitaleaceae bacterium]